MMRECPSSTKTRELLGNPSPLPSRFPSTLKISLGLRPREIFRVSGNLLGIRDGFPNTSLVLMEDGPNLLEVTLSISGSNSLWRRSPRFFFSFSNLTFCWFCWFWWFLIFIFIFRTNSYAWTWTNNHRVYSNDQRSSTCLNYSRWHNHVREGWL